MRAIAVLLAAVLVAGCTSRPATPAAPDTTRTPDVNVGKVGEWAHTADKLNFRVAKLSRARVVSGGAGAKPGAPAVAVTVEMVNNGAGRFDLSAANLTVRMGSAGYEAEQVEQDGVDQFEGTVAPGRRATVRQIFAGRSAVDLKTVSIDVAFGPEYGTFTVEGGL